MYLHILHVIGAIKMLLKRNMLVPKYLGSTILGQGHLKNSYSRSCCLNRVSTLLCIFHILLSRPWSPRICRLHSSEDTLGKREKAIWKYTDPARGIPDFCKQKLLAPPLEPSSHLWHYNHSEWLLFWQYCAMTWGITQWPCILRNVQGQDWRLWNKFWQHCAMSKYVAQCPWIFKNMCWKFSDVLRRPRRWNSQT